MTDKSSPLRKIWDMRFSNRAEEPEGEFWKKQFIKKNGELNTAVFDLAEANNHINLLKEKLAMASNLDKFGNPVQPSSLSQTSRLDIPVDLGDGTIVIISGMPGRPSRTACERLCNIIMSYAMAPQPKRGPLPIDNAVFVSEDEKSLGEIVKSEIEKQTGLVPDSNGKLYKPGSLGSKVTGSIVNPEV